MVVVRMRTITGMLAAGLGLLTLALVVGVELLHLGGLYGMILLILRLLCA